MPLAFNDSGDAVYFDAGSKAWKPAPVASNAKGEKLYYDGSAWGPGPAKGAAPYYAGGVGGPTVGAITKPMGWGERLMDVGEQALGYAAGAAPASEAGPVGVGIGGGIGMTAADIDIARRHQREYGVPIDLSAGNVAKDAAINMLGGVGGEFLTKYVAGPALGALGRTLQGQPEFRSIADLTAEKAAGVETKAVGEQAEKNLAARADVYQKTQVAQQKLTAARTDIERDTSEKLAAKQADIAKELTPKAQQQAFQEATGVTPAATAHGLTLPPEPGSALPGAGYSDRNLRFYESMTGPLRRASDEWATKRDKLMAPFMDERPDSGPLFNAINDEQQYAQQNAKVFSPAIQKLFKRASMAGGRELTPDEYMNPEFMGDLESQNLIEKPEVGAKPTLPANATDQQKLELAQQLEQRARVASAAPRIKAANVRQLLGYRSEASRLASAATTATDRHAAGALADAVDETLTQIDAPNLRGLNKQYRDFKTLFPRQFGRGLSATAEPLDYAGAIFDQPQRALHLFSGMQPEERKTLRTLYADWVNRDGMGVIKPEHAPILAQLYPNSMLATPEGFANIMSKKLGVEELLRTSPQVEQEFTQAFNLASRDIVINGLQQQTAKMITALRDMGPLGQKMVQRVTAITDPAQQYQAAVQAMTGMTPEQAMRAASATMKAPESAGREAIAEMNLPRQTAGGLPILPPTTPEEAAIAAIRGGHMPKEQYGKTAWVMNYAKRVWPYYLMIGGTIGAFTGHVSPWMAGMAGLGGASALADRLFKQGFAKALEDPTFAANFFHGVANPAAPGAMKLMARQAAQAVLGDALGTTGKKATGVSLEKKPDNTPTPLTREYDRSSAEKAVGTKDPSRVDAAAKINRDLRKSKTPDVHAGLRTGRLSMPALKNLLKQQNQKTAPSLLAHLGPADVQHLLALASPEEEQWLRPLAEQRLGRG